MLPKTNFPNACHEIFKGFPQREKHSSTLKLLFRSSLTCNNNGWNFVRETNCKKHFYFW
jgi:hypothetical protein